MATVLKDGHMTGGMTPVDGVISGMAAAHAADRIIVGRSGAGQSSTLSIIAGIISEGSSVISLGRCLESELFFASRLTKCDLCLYIKDDPLLHLELREKGGLPLRLETERIIKIALADTKMPDVKKPEGTLSDGSSFREIYRQHIEGLIPENCPYSIRISSSSPICGQILLNKGGEKELVVQLSPDGMKAALYSEESGFVPYEKLIFICCSHLFLVEQDAAIPFDFTFTVEDLAESKGRKVYRYYLSGDGEEDSAARKIAKEQNFTLDGLFLAAKVIGILCEKNISLKEAADELPEFYTSKRFVSADGDRIKRVINHWEGQRTPDGTAFYDKDSRIVIKPSVSGRGLWLSVESHTMEAAAELCGEIEEKIKKNE